VARSGHFILRKRIAITEPYNSRTGISPKRRPDLSQFNDTGHDQPIADPMNARCEEGDAKKREFEGTAALAVAFGSLLRSVLWCYAPIVSDFKL